MAFDDNIHEWQMEWQMSEKSAKTDRIDLVSTELPLFWHSDHLHLNKSHCAIPSVSKPEFNRKSSNIACLRHDACVIASALDGETKR